MAAGNWFEQGINFVVFVLLARILGAESFGLLAMAAAFVLLCEFLVRDSLSDFLISASDPEKGHFDAVFWLLAGFGAVLCIGLLLGAGMIAGFFGEPQVAGLIRALSPTVVMIALTAVPVAILRRELRFATLSLRAIAGVAVGGIVAVTMALNGFGVWSLAGQRLAQVLTNILMAWAAVSWRPGFSFTPVHRREVLGFGGAVLSLRAAELAATQLPTIIIGAIHGPVVLGLFSVAWRLVEIGSFLIVTPLRMVAQPAFAALSRGGQDAAKLLIDISKISGLLAISAFAGLSILAEPVIFLLFGAQWAPAAPVLSVLCIFGAYLCIEKINQAFCLSAGRAGATALTAWSEVALSGLLVWILAPFGVTAMAAGMVSAFLLLWPIRFRIVAQVSETAWFSLLRVHIKPAFVAGVMLAVVFAVLYILGPVSPLLQVTFGAISGVGVVLVLSWLTMRARFDIVRSFASSRKKTKGQSQ